MSVRTVALPRWLSGALRALLFILCFVIVHVNEQMSSRAVVFKKSSRYSEVFVAQVVRPPRRDRRLADRRAAMVSCSHSRPDLQQVS